MFVDFVNDPSDTLVYHERSYRFTPEQTLAEAILCDAIECINGNHRCIEHYQAKQKILREKIKAINWMRESDHDYPFSFINCCYWLHLSPSAVRKICL